MTVLAAVLALALQGQAPIDLMIERFYGARWHQSAWISPSGLSGQAIQLLDAIAQADRDGLDPADYLTGEIERLLQGDLTPGEAWSLDSLMTRAFLLYARDLSHGRIEPAGIDSLWTSAPASANLVGLLDAAIADNRLAAMLQSLPPRHPQYAALRAALQRYRDRAALGPWPATLAERLAAEGYDTADGLPAALRRFQALHGLEPDGVVGPETRAELEVPAAARALQIALNLERWRWLPASMGDRSIVVNTAAFTLELVQAGSVTFRTAAVVGRPDWPTPIVSANATSVVFRPRWIVPRTIASEEIWPLVAHDSRYLAREGLRVLADSQLVQDPGGSNPLGGAKLVFSTPFNVFIHDTPGRSAFGDSWRAVSHGCVRVENAAALVARLLPAWPAESIHVAMTGGPERWVRLPESIPVHLVYWTAWPADDGLIAFAPDIYQWDARLARALGLRPKEST